VSPFAEWSPSASRGQKLACPLAAKAPCVMSQVEGKELVFYSLDPMRGKGAQLGQIEVDMTGIYYDWGVSPDGSGLAVVRASPNHKGRIEVLTLSDRAWHQVAVEPGGGNLTSISWAPDGKGFFVTSGSTVSNDLLHVTLSGKVHPLLRYFYHGAQQLHNPLPSPDGKHLAFQVETFDSNVWMIENF
jgi:Tol biopolymer transport system component